MLQFLPKRIREGLSHLNIQFVYEIRLRANMPVRINFKGNYCYLGDYGITSLNEKAIVCTAEDIENCVFCAGDYSVYSVEEQIKRGFITAQKGVRIGLAGEYVFDKGQPLTIRNISSVCIRVPHEVVGCGEEIFQRCMSDTIPNLLLCSSPGLGKTTILRDISRLISEKTSKNVLICDERGEIFSLNVGQTCDVLKYAEKNVAFEAGIRAMRPDVIVTDELSVRDITPVEQAIFSGVCVIASAHLTCFERAQTLFKNLFDYYVILHENEIGKIKEIYDKNGRAVE